MYNKDVIDLYDRVPTGTRVTVTWNRYTTSAPVTASFGGGSGSSVVDRTSARGPSGASFGFSFPWFEQDEEAARPRRAEQPKQRAQQKRPVRSGNAPKKEQTTPVSSNAVPPQQSASVH
jgi:hypothetical protein